MKKLSVLIPVHNEEKFIRKAITEIGKAASHVSKKYELIVIEDGSSDRTFEIAKEMKRKYKNLILLHDDKRLGRGEALERGIKRATGDIVCYMDVDLSTDLSHLKQLVYEVTDGGFDVAIGARLLRESRIKRSYLREFLSRGYNLLARLLFNTPFCDLQCGFKAFKRKEIMRVVKKGIRDRHWFWDTEAMIRCYHEGLVVKEFPVKWVERRAGSKVNVKKDIFYMGKKLFELKRELSK